MKSLKRLIYIALTTLLFSCSATDGTGDSNLDIVEAGNPPTPKKRQLVGEIAASGSTCTAEIIQAYDTATTVVSAGVEDDCSFTLETTTGKAWGVRLVNEAGTTVATVRFENGPSRPDEPVYYTADDDTAIDLGLVTIASDTATPENEPAKQNDRDGDRFNDYDDGDDDNDGILDIREEDCDQDGILDDDDLENARC